MKPPRILWLAALTGACLLTAAANPWDASAQSAVPSLSLSLCRANVLPCQTRINLPTGGSTTLHLVLETPKPEDVPPLLAWEVHFQVTTPAVAGPFFTTQIPPVEPLPWWSVRDSPAEVFTLQNDYNPLTGHLDYSIMLVDTATGGGPHPRPLTSDGTRTVLGKIDLRAEGPGQTEIVPEASQGPSSRVVHLDSNGKIHTTFPKLAGPHLAFVTVGAVATTQVEGRLTSPAWDLNNSGRFPPTLTVTFWRPGSVPPWRGGSAKPRVTFAQVQADRGGWFQVTDLPPSLLPPGEYDLRVRALGSLAQIVPTVTIPTPDQFQQTVSVTVPPLQSGDLNADDKIDSKDLALLKNTFGKTSPSNRLPNIADFNQDAIVDAADFSILADGYRSQSH